MRLYKRFLTLAAIVFTAFSSLAQNKQLDSTAFFHPDHFLRDTLYIETRFMECGEFGGHLELSKIYIKGNDFYLTYQQFSADCSKIKENNGKPPQTLVQTITKPLFAKDQLLIRRYIHQMVDAKFREPALAHAGYVFRIRKLDGSINLFVYTAGEQTRQQYSEFIRGLIENE